MQVGRAGRSEEEAWAHLFLNDSDFRKLRSLGHSDEIDAGQVESLLKEIFDPDLQYILLPISKTVNELDMKEEVLDTLISYLEVIFALNCIQESPQRRHLYSAKLKKFHVQRGALKNHVTAGIPMNAAMEDQTMPLGFSSSLNVVRKK